MDRNPGLVADIQRLIRISGIFNSRAPNMDKLRPGWTVVRRNLAVTKTEDLHNTTVRRDLSVIGVHPIDMVTPSEG
ncbi:hypothetical protein HPB50_003419 [Hyalomma asiaticum]|uniref:Uncharacterized protein n=1 Tax=Hyalomma asiaticum TaxID=266040 RepID=A0ACB7SMV7_HYAAI|nr:hypothetical protein HPB50_003419 [Hyalomma asiaticum]